MFRRALFLAFASLFTTSALFAETEGAKEKTEEVKEKTEEVKEKTPPRKLKKLPLPERPDITISGNVQVKWQEIKEEARGERLRFRPSNQVWASEANLWFDHRTDCTWATINLRFSNYLGKFSGGFNDLSLQRAFMGYQLWECVGGCSGQVELGRMKLGDRFQSEVQYRSHFDGVLFGFRSPLEGLGDLQLQAGVMVVDFRTAHYSWIIGLDLNSLWDTGWYFKYSYIDWAKRERDREYQPVNPRFQFRNSQWILGYRFPIERFDLPVHFNGGFVWNHAARRLPRFRNYLGNTAWWVKLEIGSIVKACDWAFKVGYQWVELQSILETDVAGIGRGNIQGGSIYNPLIEDPELLFGNTNYKGPTFTFIFAVTDNLSVQADYAYSMQITPRVGGLARYSKAEIKAVYAF